MNRAPFPNDYESQEDFDEDFQEWVDAMEADADAWYDDRAERED